MKWKGKAITFAVGMGVALISGLMIGLNQATEFMTKFQVGISVILAVAGIAIGFWNFDKKETPTALVSGLILSTMSLSLAFVPQVNDVVSAIFQSISALVVPATVILALKTWLQDARD